MPGLFTTACAEPMVSASLTNRPSGCEFHTRRKYAQERCRSEAPGEAESAPGHEVRCHFPLNP